MTALLMGGLAGSVGAQGVTIDPGMTREQVVAKLGEPASVRTYDGHTYLHYKNGCEKTCGMSDLVVLDSGKVVDAVFRASGRKYSGTSSSPRMISQAEAKRVSGGGAPLALPSGEAKPSEKMEPKAAPAPKKTAPVKPAAPSATPSKSAAAPGKTTTAPATKAGIAPAPKTPPATAPAKKSDVPPPKPSAAPEKKTEPAPAAKKPDAPPAKKDTTKKKPPATHET
jgi:hypothetical protein